MLNRSAAGRIRREHLFSCCYCYRNTPPSSPPRVGFFRHKQLKNLDINKFIFKIKGVVMKLGQRIPDRDKYLRKGKVLLNEIEELKELVAIDPHGPKRKKKAGRPPVSHKEKLKRAEKEFESIKIEVKKIFDEEGVCSRNVVQKMRNYKDRYARAGRPGRSEVAEIEYKIRQREQRIIRIESGAEESADDQKSSEKSFGRPRKSKEQKLAKLRADIDKLKAQVDKKYSKVKEDEKKNIELERLRVTAFNIRKQIREGDIADNIQDAQYCFENMGEHLDLVTQLARLEQLIEEKESELGL